LVQENPEVTGNAAAYTIVGVGVIGDVEKCNFSIGSYSNCYPLAIGPFSGNGGSNSCSMTSIAISTVGIIVVLNNFPAVGIYIQGKGETRRRRLSY